MWQSTKAKRSAKVNTHTHTPTQPNANHTNTTKPNTNQTQKYKAGNGQNKNKTVQMCTWFLSMRPTILKGKSLSMQKGKNMDEGKKPILLQHPCKIKAYNKEKQSQSSATKTVSPQQSLTMRVFGLSLHWPLGCPYLRVMDSKKERRKLWNSKNLQTWKLCCTSHREWLVIQYKYPSKAKPDQTRSTRLIIPN